MSNKNSVGRFLVRFYVEALIVGIVIGLGALLVEQIAGSAGWGVRLLTLALVGGALCGFQYALRRWWR
ncbi:MAG: hypothetical protein AB4911_12175 [Oscillochloridaceae bacterium umkhey_bin13]